MNLCPRIPIRLYFESAAGQARSLRHADQSKSRPALLAFLVESVACVADTQFQAVRRTDQSNVNRGRTGMLGDILQAFLNDTIKRNRGRSQHVRRNTAGGESRRNGVSRLKFFA